MIMFQEHAWAVVLLGCLDTRARNGVHAFGEWVTNDYKCLFHNA